MSQSLKVESTQTRFYCSNHCRSIVTAIVTTGVLQPSPSKKSCPEIMKEEMPPKNKEWPLNLFFGFNNMNVGLITFLISGSGSCLLSVRTCR
jgi:hypothetical protein